MNGLILIFTIICNKKYLLPDSNLPYSNLLLKYTEKFKNRSENKFFSQKQSNRGSVVDRKSSKMYYFLYHSISENMVCTRWRSWKCVRPWYPREERNAGMAAEVPRRLRAITSNWTNSVQLTLTGSIGWTRWRALRVQYYPVGIPTT